MERYARTRADCRDMIENGILLADLADGLTETVFSDIRVFDDASSGPATLASWRP